ncbi:MAG: hypothetical protein ACKOQ4_05335 [Mycobacterium sp.]
MNTTTRMFARVIGPYLLVVPITAAVRAPDMQKLLSDVEASPVWPWFGGAITVLLGLIVVGLHPYWTNPPAVIISALGWLMVARGILLLAFPAALMSAANAVIGTGAIWRVAYAILALLGLYLTVVGWRPGGAEVRSGRVIDADAASRFV